MALWLAGIAPALGAVKELNVRDYGAKGDGTTLDSPAINAAIAATGVGGGIVRFPAGRYLSYSIRLKSHLTLQLDAGAVLVAADPATGSGTYDAAEPNEWDQYQDFGHSHWHNSLIWGDGIEDVAIVGPGLIDGTKGLVRFGPPPRRPAPAKGAPATPPTGEPPGVSPGQFPHRNMDGLGNKAIALKNCRHVTLRDFSVLNGGHFALLATGVDHLTIANLKVDTNRDGFDIDACRNVRVSDCQVNSPNDDAIVLKTSFALGTARATEKVLITGCHVSGYDAGSLLDGTLRRTMERAPDRDGPTGRIKLGTESNGAFRDITISNCVFERSRGLAIESVDGGIIEDVTVKNLTMREIVNSPIFLRLGNRARGPAGTPVGAIRRVKISDVTAQDADARYACVLLTGLPGHAIENVTLNNITIVARGGLSPAVVAEQPAGLVNPFFLRGQPGATGPREPLAVPERENGYPEPSMFGLLPGSVVYARHVLGLKVNYFTVSFTQPDTRPLVVLDDAASVKFDHFQAPRPASGAAFVLRSVRDFKVNRSPGVPDTRQAAAGDLDF